MKFILDFDRVIFNWDAYVAVLKEQGLESLLVDPKIWDTLKVSDFYYPDAVAFLEQTPRESITVISAYTPSYGPLAQAYQERKIAESGMEEFATEVVVMTGDKGPYVCERAADVTVFVDDKLEHHQSVRQHCADVCCFQMVRSGGSLESAVSTDPSIPIIPDFVALGAIINAW